MDELVEIAAREIVRARNPLLAAGAHWPIEIAHHRKMVAEHGAIYEGGHSTITDAFRDARAALTALQEKGYAVERRGVSGLMRKALEDIAAKERVVGEAQGGIIIMEVRAFLAALDSMVGHLESPLSTAAVSHPEPGAVRRPKAEPPPNPRSAP